MTSWSPGWLVWFASAAVAQDAATIGTFVDLDGRAVANATVTFATSSPDLFDTFTRAQCVEAMTDANGRFRAVLRAGTAWSAWAIGPPADGTRWRSGVHENVIAGSVLAIKAAGRTATGSLTFDDLEQLGAGPFTAEIRLQAVHAPTFLLPINAASVTLPELPLADYKVRLRDQAGTLRCAEVPRWSDHCTIPILVRTPVQVVDEAGRGVAGVRVGVVASTLFGSAPLQFARRELLDVIEGPPTDAEGRTVVEHAEYGSIFVAWTADRHARVARPRGTPIVDGELTSAPREQAGPAAPVRLVLRHGPVLRGRLHAGGSPVVGRGIAVHTTIACSGQGAMAGMTTRFDHATTVRSGDDGTFAVPDVPRPVAAMQLRIESGDDVPVLARARAEVPERPIDLDLTTWPRVALRPHAGGPTPPAVQYMLWPAAPELGAIQPVVLAGDRGGRANARLEPGDWFVVATDGASYAAELVTVAPGTALERQLRLQPLARMTGRVVDATGSPVASARFAAGGWGAQNPDLGSRRAQLIHAHFATINGALIPAAQCDAAGRFEIRLLPAEGCAMHAQVWGGTGRTSLVVQPVEDVEVRLTR